MLFTEEVVKFVFREEGFQHPLKEDKEEAFVELLVLEHVKDVEGALAYGVCAHHGAHLICQRHQHRKHFHHLFSLAISLCFLLLLTICPPPPPPPQLVGCCRPQFNQKHTLSGDNKAS